MTTVTKQAALLAMLEAFDVPQFDSDAAMSRYGKHPVVNRWFEWGETSDPSNSPLTISGAQEIALQDIISTAIEEAKREQREVDAKVCDEAATAYSSGTFNDCSREVRAVEECAAAIRKGNTRMTTPLSEQELAEIAERLSDVGSAEWVDFADGYRGHEIQIAEPFTSLGYIYSQSVIRFIINAHNADIPRLLSLVGELQAELATLKAKDEWQDISSAPKETTVLLGAEGCELVETGYAEFIEYLCTDRHRPTRWKPLPPAPTSDRREQMKVAKCEGNTHQQAEPLERTQPLAEPRHAFTQGQGMGCMYYTPDDIDGDVYGQYCARPRQDLIHQVVEPRHGKTGECQYVIDHPIHQVAPQGEHPNPEPAPICVAHCEHDPLVWNGKNSMGQTGCVACAHVCDFTAPMKATGALEPPERIWMHVDKCEGWNLTTFNSGPKSDDDIEYVCARDSAATPSEGWESRAAWAIAGKIDIYDEHEWTPEMIDTVATIIREAQEEGS